MVTASRTFANRESRYPQRIVQVQIDYTIITLEDVYCGIVANNVLYNLFAPVDAVTEHPPLKEQCHHQHRLSRFSVLIRLNRLFHLGKNRNRSNRFIAIYCDLLRFIAIYCDFFLGNQIRRREKTEENCKDLLP